MALLAENVGEVATKVWHYLLKMWLKGEAMMVWQYSPKERWRVLATKVWHCSLKMWLKVVATKV